MTAIKNYSEAGIFKNFLVLFILVRFPCFVPNVLFLIVCENKVLLITCPSLLQTSQKKKKIKIEQFSKHLI